MSPLPSKLTVIVILLVIFALSFYHRKKIQRFVDNDISKSTLSQIGLFTIIKILVVGLLILIILKINSNLKIEISSRVLSFINPGSTLAYTIKEADKLWAIIIGIFGMILLVGLLISVLSNCSESRVEKMKNYKVHYLFHNDICLYHTISDLDTQLEKVKGNKIKNTRVYNICLSKSIPMILKYNKEIKAYDI